MKTKVKLTKDQKQALKDYNFCLSEEDRYLGSVFANANGQKLYEMKTKIAYERCKSLGMDWQHGL